MISTESNIIRVMLRTERFVKLIYEDACSTENLNKARKQLFAQKGRSSEILSAREHALTQYINRAV